MSLQVMSVVPLEKGKARIRFDDGTEVVLYKGEIRKLGIEEGCVVTEAVYDKILNEHCGRLFREFSFVVAGSVIISSFAALTFSNRCSVLGLQRRLLFPNKRVNT